MFLSDSKIGFRFGRDQADPENSPLRTAMNAAGRPATPPPMRLRPAPVDGEQAAVDETRAEKTLDDGEPLVLNTPAPAQTAAGQEQRPMQPIIAQARAAIAQAPAEDEARALDSVLRTIEELSARHEAQEKEAQAIRESMARMTADTAKFAEEKAKLTAETDRLAQDKARLNEEKARLAEERNRVAEEKAKLAEENQQLRDLLNSLLRTVEQERRRRSEALSRINERLNDMVAPAAAEAPASKAA